MHGKSLLTIVLMCLAAMPFVASGAPQHDPANVDSGGGGDSAAVFSGRAPAQQSNSGSLLDSARSAIPQGGALDQMVQQAGEVGDRFPAFGMPSLTPDDYRQAYGNADVRSRLGRTYESAGSSRGMAGGQGWLDQMMTSQGGRSALDVGGSGELMQSMRPLQDVMGDMGRQLMPVWQDFQHNLDTELNRSRRGSQR